jgi:hypothetical protein
VAHARVHGTTHERPGDRLLQERAHLQALPGAEQLVPFRREARKVGRDGYVQWERAWYGVSWTWAGQQVQVQANPDTVELWAGSQRLAVHPRASRPGQRLTVPGQWAALPTASSLPRREALAVQLPNIEVQHRSLAIYEALVASGGAQ